MEENKFFTVEHNEDSVVVTFVEESKVDATNYSEIEEIVMNFIDTMSESEFVFDLKNVIYVSSAGLRMFSAINNAVSDAGIDYKLINLKKNILSMFQLTGYSSMFKVEGQPDYNV